MKQRKRIVSLLVFLSPVFWLASSRPAFLPEYMVDTNDRLEERISRLAQPYIENEVEVGLGSRLFAFMLEPKWNGIIKSCKRH